MHPRQMRDTSSPVRPRRMYSMDPVPLTLQTRHDNPDPSPWQDPSPLPLVYLDLRRASRLHGPAPNCETSNAPPNIERFFRNMIICIWAIMGSFTAQKLCIIGVTAMRNSAISHAPIRAL